MAVLAAASILAGSGRSASPGRQAAMTQVLHVYSTLAGFPHVSISPDGTRVAFAFEFYHAMQTLGVPRIKPDDRIDTFTRTIEWFDRYLK